MPFRCLALVLLSAPLAAQAPRSLTAADYARAERFLARTAAPLVSGLGVRATWLSDDRFWYRTPTANGFDFVMIDVARRARASAFDQSRLGAALQAATGGGFNRDSLPYRTFELSRDGRELRVEVAGRRWKCDLPAYACAPIDTAAAIGPPPAHSVVSPDGRRAAFIRDFNLWVRDLATGRDSRLTTDGVLAGHNYDDQANQLHADKLRGKLLLAHGTLDDNVPPYNTELVVDALIKANKDFDLLMLPNQRHGFGSMSSYMMRRRWDYFVKNLMGAEPPKEYEIGRPRLVP